MAGEPLLAFFVGFEDGFIGFRLLIRQPCQQRWAEVEADMAIIVRDFLDVLKTIQNSRHAVGGVTFCGDAFVPVMEWVCGVLQFDKFQPRVLARRLVEVSVNTNISVHQSWNSFSKSSTACG